MLANYPKAINIKSKTSMKNRKRRKSVANNENRSNDNVINVVGERWRLLLETEKQRALYLRVLGYWRLIDFIMTIKQKCIAKTRYVAS